MQDLKSRKKEALICVLLLVIIIGMDMRFYVNYVWNRDDYVLCSANISEVSYKHYGKSGAYESKIEYLIDKKPYQSTIRTAIGDTVGSQIQIGVKKNDYAKATRSSFYIEKKSILHSLFVGGTTVYLIYLLFSIYKTKFIKGE